MTTPTRPFVPVLGGRIRDVATRCLALTARPQRPAEVRAAELQRRVDVAAQALAREGCRS